MKTIIALIFALACAVAAPPSSERGGDELSSKYVYDYTAKMKVQVSEVDHHSTQLEMKAKVELIFLPTKDEVMLKVTDALLFDVIKDVPRGYEELKTESQLSSIVAKYLQWPVYFVYKDGLVKSIFSKLDDPLWSVNIKKSIINLLQVDVKGRAAVAEPNVLFKKEEESVFGICHTTYSIQDILVTDGVLLTKAGMNVTKVINTRNCILQNAVISDSLIPRPPAVDDESPLDSAAIIEYNIIGDELKFKIQKVNATGVHAVYPYDRDVESVVAMTHQTLVLLEETTQAVPIKETPERQDQGTLTLKLPALHEPEFLFSWKQKDYETLSEFILTTLTTFIQKLSPEEEPAELVKILTTEDTETILVLINSLKLCKVDMMEKMWVKSDMKTRKWLLYILSKCPTDECIKFVLTKIRDTDITKEQIEEYLISASFIGNPTLPQVEKMFEICQLPKVIEDKKLLASCYAAASNLLKTLCRVLEVCPLNTALETKIYAMLQPLTTATAASEEVMYIEGMPTTVILSIAENILNKPSVQPGFYTLLETIIQRQELPTDIRVRALVACKPLIRMNPKRLRIILMKLIHDLQQHIELRMIAFVVLMENPSPATIQICSRQMHMEPSLQVRRFIYDHIRSVATEVSKLKYTPEIIRACQIALNLIVRGIIPSGFLHNSRHIDMKQEMKRLNVGFYASMDSIYTTEAILPRHIHNKLNMTVLGRTFTVLEAEMRIEGVQEYLEKFFGADGMYYKKKSIMDFIRKMPITKEKLVVPDDKMSLFTQVKMLDKIFFVHYTNLKTNEDLQSLLLKGAIFRAAELEAELQKGKVFTWFKPMVPIEVLYKLPTLVGIPLHCNMTSILLPRVKTELKVEVKPHIFSTATLLSKERESVKVAIKHGVSGIGQSVASMFFSLPCYEVGMTVRSTLNVSTIVGGTVSWSKETSRIQVAMDLPQETKDIVTFKRERHHFIKPYPMPETTDKTIFTNIIVEPSNVGELTILKVSKHCTECGYEEWTLQTQNKKFLSVKGTKIILGENPTIFRVYFHGKQRNLINLMVPTVGHVTMSRKSEALIINPSLTQMGKVFQIEYKSINTIVLKTWAILEKTHVPKLWPKLESHVLDAQVQEYEKMRQVMYQRKENLMEQDELPAGTQHIQAAYLTIKDSLLCVTPVLKDAMVFVITKEADMEEELRRRTYEGGYCIGKSVKLCLQGYYSIGSSKSAALTGPMELRLRIIPEVTAPTQLKVRVDQRATEASLEMEVKVNLIKQDIVENMMIIDATFEYGAISSMNIQVQPQGMPYMFEKLCINSMSQKDGYKMWLSLDKQCEVKHLQIERVISTLMEPFDLRKSTTLRLTYDKTKLTPLWRQLIENLFLKRIMPYLKYNSKHMAMIDNTLLNGVVAESALLEFLLTSEHTIRMRLMTPSITLTFNDIMMPYPILSLPVGSKEVPVISRVKDVLAPTCSIRGSTFTTFDKATYEYAPTEECYHTLVQECAATSRFRVYVRKQMPNAFALRINDGVSDYDIIPQKLITAKPIVQIAGVAVTFVDKHVKLDLTKTPLYTITWEAEHQHLIFTHHKLGLVVSLREGRIITVKPSNWYHNKLCGMCGNFDGEKFNDLRTPENIISMEPTLFGSSWIIPQMKCEGCSKMRARIETSVTESRYCQTRIPIVKCMETCKAVSVKKIKVQALCVPNKPDLKTLLLESFTKKSLVLTKDMTLSLEEVEVPLKCSCDCQNTKLKKKQ